MSNESKGVEETLQRKTSQLEFLRKLLVKAGTAGYDFAFWKLPDSGTIHGILSASSRTISKDTPLEDLNAGFLFAPFDHQATSFYLDGGYRIKLHTDMPDAALDTSLPQEWLKEIEETNLPLPAHPKVRQHAEVSDAFVSLVNTCLYEIQKGSFEKVVPSRFRQYTLDSSFDAGNGFFRLCNQYPHAFVSLVCLSGQGLWMGASPELLVSMEDQTIFRTVALAGTQPYQPGIELKNVAWTQKEIEEQALVERYIISCFKKIRLREYEEYGPKTFQAGNLLHLKSDFRVDMKATRFPQLGTVMLKLLHPTSAVCGMPMDKAYEFLKAHEGYDRSFYAGYLGPVNVDNQVNLFVNLRCMHVQHGQARVFAGAGVTADSDPQLEWMETQVKMDTLANVLF